MYGDLSRYIKDPAMKHNARYITMQLLEGIRSLHMNNICHRDLKPQVSFQPSTN
jgi:serine/threonine protein kinase